MADGIEELTKIIVKAAKSRPTSQVPKFVWATVVQAYPSQLKVVRDGEDIEDPTAALYVTSSGVHLDLIREGDRVQCVWQGTQLSLVTDKLALERSDTKATEAKTEAGEAKVEAGQAQTAASAATAAATAAQAAADAAALEVEQFGTTLDGAVADAAAAMAAADAAADHTAAAQQAATTAQNAADAAALAAQTAEADLAVAVQNTADALAAADASAGSAGTAEAAAQLSETSAAAAAADAAAAAADAAASVQETAAAQQAAADASTAAAGAAQDAVVAEQQAVAAANAAADAVTAATEAAASAADAVMGTDIEYALSTSDTVPPSTGSPDWSTATPTRTPGTYVWARTVITYGNGSESRTSPAVWSGEAGESGDSGRGIVSTALAYQASPSGTAVPQGSWSPTPIQADPGEYVWTRTTFNYTDNTSSATYSVGRIGEDGAPGGTGVGVSGAEVRYQLAASGTVAPTGTWSETPLVQTTALPYLWTRTITSYTSGSPTTAYSVSKLGATGAAGRGITSAEVMYAASSSGTVTPTTGWQGTMPDAAPGQYIWTRVITSYTTGTPTTAYSVGRIGSDGNPGDDAVGVDTVVVGYQLSASGTAAPSGSWAGTPLTATEALPFLWTRTLTTYTDASSSTAYSVARRGDDGEQGTPGRGIASTAVQYAASSSGTLVPTTGWGDDPPAAAPGQYVWTRTVITYTSGSPATTTGYSVSRLGEDGAAGGDGRGVLSTEVRYQLATSGTVAPTGTWAVNPLVQTLALPYLWTRTITSYTSGTPTTAYSVSKLGATGATGNGITSVKPYFLRQLSTAGTPATPTANPPGGNWVAAEPGYLEGTSLWRTEQIIYTSGLVQYTAPTKITAYEAVSQLKIEAIAAAATDAANKAATAKSEAIAAAALTAQEKADLAEAAALAWGMSRGTDLVTNGTGMLGDNTNFTGFTFDPDAPVGAAGSFVATTPGSRFNTELIPVDPTKSYRLSLQLKNGTPGAEAKAYTGLVPYDAEGMQIQPNNYVYDPGTLGELAQPLNPGDTQLVLKDPVDAAEWSKLSTYKHVGVWNYTDGNGRVWPYGTYTRHYRPFTSASGNTITLAAPWPYAAYPVGTPISRTYPGGTYMYQGAINTVIPEEWTHFTGTWTGVADGARTGTWGAVDSFPVGTAFVKVLLWNNSSASGAAVKFAAISLSDAAAAQAVAEAANYAANNITATQITDEAITTPKLATNAVEASKIAANAVVAGKIAANAVLADNIKAGELTGDKLVANTITSAYIATGAIDTEELAAGAVTTLKLDALAVTADKLAANAVTAGKIDADAINGMTITGATLQTSETAERGLKFYNGGLFAYDGSGNLKASISATTGAFWAAGGVVTNGNITGGEINGSTLKGTLIEGATLTGLGVIQTSAAANTGVKITSAGITAYNSGTARLTISNTGVITAADGKFTGAEITGTSTITGATVQTSATAARGIKLTSSGLFVYSSTGASRFTVDASTGDVTSIGGTFTGSTFQTDAATNVGIKFNSLGIRGYSGGAARFTLATDGTMQATGATITASSIVGTTNVSGALLQTSTASNRGIKLSSAALVAYDSSTSTTPTFTLDASTGHVTSVGGTFTGATFQTSASATVGLKMSTAGIVAYSGGVPSLTIESNGDITANSTATFSAANLTGGTITGVTVQTHSTLRGVKMNTGGLYGYTSGGTLKFSLNATTGALWTDSADIDGGTITGATFRTAASGTRMELNNSTQSAVWYDGTAEVGNITRSGQALYLRGGQIGNDASITMGLGFSITTAGNFSIEPTNPYSAGNIYISPNWGLPESAWQAAEPLMLDSSGRLYVWKTAGQAPIVALGTVPAGTSIASGGFYNITISYGQTASRTPGAVIADLASFPSGSGFLTTRVASWGTTSCIVRVVNTGSSTYTIPTGGINVRAIVHV